MKENSAEKIAAYLLSIKAVKLQPTKPFTWASGLKSPIYCDNRKTLSYPEIRTYICNAFVKTIQKEFKKPDVIAGVATGGIAQGALVANALDLPFVYVRAEAKKHGLTNLVEGEIKKGQSVVVIEDLISTGGSSLKAVEALKEQGCKIVGLAAIFTYQFKQSADAFKKAKCKLITLSNYDTLVKQAVELNYIKKQEIVSLKKWKENPETWYK